MKTLKNVRIEKKLIDEEPYFMSGEPAEESFHPRQATIKNKPFDNKDSEELAEKSFHPIEMIPK